MAKFQPILGELRGSIGANTWSHNKGGDYVRQRGTPTNPNSTRQQSVRSILSTLAAGYGALTAVQQESWKTWAQNNPRQDPLGNSYTLTGLQAYISVNAKLSDAGLTLLTSAPAGQQSTEEVGPTVTFTSATAISVAFTGSAPTGSCLEVWCTKPQNGGGDPNFDQATLVGYSAANPTTPVAMTLPFSVQTGQTMNFFVAFMTSEGLTGAHEKDTETKS